MALYALGDLHLAFGADKPMDVFGGRWEGYTDKLREDTVYTETFTVETDSMGVISAQIVCSKKVSASVAVTDPEGEEIYNSADPLSGNGIAMEKGEYTVTYIFDVPDDGVAYDVSASVMVVATSAVSTESSFGSV